MRLIVDKILWGMLLVFFGPTVMIVASWNALPGDNLYGVKIALEKTALAFASPSFATTGSLQIKYTERRFAEAKQLMASKQSIQGLPYLESQIAQTKKAIETAPNKEAQVALAKQYINTLSTVSTDLETQKQSITQSPQPVAYAPPRPTVVPTSDVKEVPTSEVKNPTSTPTSHATPTPTPIQIAQVTTSTPIPTQQAVVALQIDQTQQNVNQTIADLQALVKTQGFQGKPPELTEEEKRERERRGTHSKEERRKKIDDVPRIQQEQEEERDNDNDR